MKKRFLGLLLQAPAILVLVAAFFASSYAWLTKQYEIGFMTPLTILVILAIYFWGRVLENKRDYF